MIKKIMCSVISSNRNKSSYRQYKMTFSKFQQLTKVVETTGKIIEYLSIAISFGKLVQANGYEQATRLVKSNPQ